MGDGIYIDLTSMLELLNKQIDLLRDISVQLQLMNELVQCIGGFIFGAVLSSAVIRGFKL